MTNRKQRPGAGSIQKVSLVDQGNQPEPLRAVLDDDEAWVPLTGNEQAIVGDLSILTDGAPVKLLPSGEGEQPELLTEARLTLRQPLDC